MATITVGVPVYNGSALLRESLQCLRDQTYRDIEVLIADNCSTDNSAAIAQEFVDADPRFRLIRRPENIGAISNFCTVVEEASTPLFMWRADDDLSDLNFIEKLKARWDEDTSADLIAPRIVRVDAHGTKISDVSFPVITQRRRSARIRDMLTHASPVWVYGLWNRERLLNIIARTNPDYSYPWAWDQILLLPVLLDESVLGCDETSLWKRRFFGRFSSQTSARNMFAMRRAFRKSCFRELDLRQWSFIERIYLFIYVHRYANRRVYRFLKATRRLIREKLGLIK